MVLSVLGPMTQDGLPVADPALETSPPSLCRGSAGDWTGLPTIWSESRCPEHQAPPESDGGDDPGLSSAARAAPAFLPFTSIHNQIRPLTGLAGHGLV